MSSRPKMVMAVFRNRLDAQSAFDRLILRGYRNNEINVLMSDTTRSKFVLPESEERLPTRAGTQATEGMGVGGAIGTAVGATLAAVAAIGTTLVLPGLGLVVAGPLAAALAGGGAGAVTGGILGALIGWGIPEPDVDAYQLALSEGGIVMGVVPRTAEDVSAIQEIYTDLGGESICYC